jgi:DNA modification methylase
MRPGLAATFRRRPIVSAQQIKPGVRFQDWIGTRSVPSLSTNAGAAPLPFQQWHKFKEAFSPELVAKAISGSERKVRRLCDPFGGSGTSALAAQFMGIESVSIEVNPFLADLIEAKTTIYRARDLVSSLPRVARRARKLKVPSKFFASIPETFVEPGRAERWLFDAPVAAQVAQIRAAVDEEADPAIRRLFRVILGGILVEFSNAVVSGKGRRYRRAWETRKADPSQLLPHFCESVGRAIMEIDALAERKVVSAAVIRGDSRELIGEIGAADLILSSPPYPNSFDYTDVYNIELWMLGYLSSSAGNQLLRHSTLSSHVQIRRPFAEAPHSETLIKVMRKLRRARESLWDKHLVEMVGGYFGDLNKILHGCVRALRSRGQIWLVVGDSQYNGIHIEVAKILAEMAPALGLKRMRIEPFRSMRLSPQQGGNHKLAENLLIMRKV